MERNTTSKLKAVVLQSDDWGFCGWTPDQGTAEALGYNKMSLPHQHYGNSGLEGASEMERLFAVLESITDGAGLPVVMQPNYIVSVPDYDRMIKENYGTWRFRDLDSVNHSWSATGIIEQAREGIRRGVWRPEYHGNTHCAATLILNRCRSGDLNAISAMNMHCPPFHEIRCGAEYAGTTPLEVSAGIATFKRLFGYEPISTVPGNYTTNHGAFSWWRKSGIKVIQALERFVPTNRLARIVLRLHQRMSISRYPGHFLNSTRDVDFEPRGANNGSDTYAEEVLEETKTGLSNRVFIGIGTHRLNYVHHSSDWVQRSLAALHSFLSRLLHAYPNLVFLTDDEFYQLRRRGASISRRGEWCVLRNFGRAPTQLAVQVEEYPELQNQCRTHNTGITFSQGKAGRVEVTIPPGCHKLNVA